MDLKKIARNLERERCIKHNESPTATPKKDSIELSCCCEDFKSKLIAKMKSEIAQQAKDDILKVFKR